MVIELIISKRSMKHTFLSLQERAANFEEHLDAFQEKFNEAVRFVMCNHMTEAELKSR